MSDEPESTPTGPAGPAPDLSLRLVAHLLNGVLRFGKARPEEVGAWALETAAGIARALRVRERVFVQMARSAYAKAPTPPPPTPPQRPALAPTDENRAPAPAPAGRDPNAP